MSTQDAVLVVVPAFNEEASLPATLTEISAAMPAAKILVVDDGSRDGTADVATSYGCLVLRLPFNLGVGGAMRAGYLYAQRNGYGTVVQVDADGQHDPAVVPQLLTALTESGVDILIAARFGGVGDYRVRGPRRWAMKALAAAVSHRTGAHLTDVTSGFRAAGPRAVQLFARYYPADYLGDTVESLLLAHSAGLRIAQVPITMRTRQAGRPSTRPFRSTLYLIRALLVLVIFLARRRVARTDLEADGAVQRTGD